MPLGVCGPTEALLLLVAPSSIARGEGDRIGRPPSTSSRC